MKPEDADGEVWVVNEHGKVVRRASHSFNKKVLSELSYTVLKYELYLRDLKNCGEQNMHILKMPLEALSCWSGLPKDKKTCLMYRQDWFEEELCGISKVHRTIIGDIVRSNSIYAGCESCLSVDSVGYPTYRKIIRSLIKLGFKFTLPPHHTRGYFKSSEVLYWDIDDDFYRFLNKHKLKRLSDFVTFVKRSSAAWSMDDEKIKSVLKEIVECDIVAGNITDTAELEKLRSFYNDDSINSIRRNIQYMWGEYIKRNKESA